MTWWVETAAAANLLTNSGFENGSSGQPDDWTTSTLAGTPTYTWDSTKSNNGSYSVRIECEESDTGMWRQSVPVSAGTVYLYTGYVSFDSIVEPNYCNLEVVFNAGGPPIQFADLPKHDGTRDFAFDFPAKLKFRAPADAVNAQVKCFLQGPGTA